MKLDIVLEAEEFSPIFKHDYKDANLSTIKKRIRQNNKILTKQIYQKWEDDFAIDPILNSLFVQWLPIIISSQKELLENNFILLSNVPEVDEENIYIQGAISSENKEAIVVGNYTYAKIKENQNVYFSTKEDFMHVPNQRINFNQLNEIVKKGGKLNKVFNMFEIPLEVEVPSGKNASVLAEYFSKFYDEKYLEIHDSYFHIEKNQLNFEKYILPYVQKLNIEDVHIVIQSGDVGRIHKSRLEQKYRSKCPQVRFSCKEKTTIHAAQIITSNYQINYTYRMMIFGEDNKTKADRVSIFQKNV